MNLTDALVVVAIFVVFGIIGYLIGQAVYYVRFGRKKKGVA